MKVAGLRVLEMNGEPDYIRILFEAPPSIDPAKMVNGLKTGPSRMTRKNFPDELAPYYWKPAFWSMSYFICTVSDRNAETLKRYIQDQDIK
ncbi:IS200/IS605 family transposase [Erysipelotrichaceae bacterium RD49]|nr:IS200/IS605 family transposase [Erysipelotrichaceae bacterium RD49]